ncbi:MAG: 4-(cytidine 5'-diphospho)-2-C-methyl-D-erythritol kinase [Candidatus Zipacnadales bacterium]
MSGLSKSIRVRCRAKLNLVLEVVGRRPDGFHDLATIMHPIELADEITIRPADCGIALTTTGLPSPRGAANMAFRAAATFARTVGVNPAFVLHLDKRIPLEAGLGGGSADAAGVLAGLAQLYSWPADDPNLMHAARSLGADVPFFLGTGAALVEGIGERLTLLPAAKFICVLALGTWGVNTKWAYSQVTQAHYSDGSRAREMAAALCAGRPIQEVWNSFLVALAMERPDLLGLVDQMKGLVSGPAGLTGSGAGVFGLAADRAEAQHVAKVLEALGYWTWWGCSANQPLSIETFDL